MTRIDFHSNVADPIQYACRLARKARGANNNIIMLTRPEALAALDQALWDFAEDAFLPHVQASDPLAERTPIVLTDSDAADLPHHQILINLSGSTPMHFARFERLIEIIPAQESEKNAGRERFSFYKQRGYPLAHFDAEGK